MNFVLFETPICVLFDTFVLLLCYVHSVWPVSLSALKLCILILFVSKPFCFHLGFDFESERLCKKIDT